VRFQIWGASALFAGALLFAEQDARLQAVEKHLVAQEFPQALASVDAFLQQQPRHVGALKLKGDIHYLLAQDSSAEQAFSKAISIDPKHTQAHYALGRLYYQQSRYPLAIEQFNKVLQLAPGFYKAHDNLGLCFEHLGEHDSAIRHFLKAIDLVHKEFPEYDWPYANLANLLINRAEYKQAFNLAVEAAQRNPNSARNYYLAAKALTKLDQAPKSERWLQRSIELDPEYPEPRYLLARLLQQQGKTAEAEREFARFRELRDKAPLKLR
jgi:tetratricopeptide (TPR) repeat protein